ncbi:hypothetical protein BCR44DRAFT_1435322 [Catenaria anguillulae PL171]|uniref:HTH cro/C1-type domain-containing protein n=1 Tax=Catenaria anguillulae PL171 TaxID=765915 RepID=A0A1Y2HJW6_9FUNG|nr:hypothetical protein BCR44DRAFT_1435322 [Catenaria anguillulae PL171]
MQGNVGWDDPIVIRSRNAQSASATRTGPPPRPPSMAAVLDKRPTAKNKGASSVKAGSDHRHIAKVDREDEQFHIKHVPLDVGRAIMKARQDKELTQKDLATKINEKPTVVADYEAGRAQPNQQILTKLERALGVKLRGKDIGQPLAPRGSSATAAKKA